MKQNVINTSVMKSKNQLLYAFIMLSRQGLMIIGNMGNVRVIGHLNVRSILTHSVVIKLQRFPPSYHRRKGFNRLLI